jgi:hypothetical protein
MGSDRTQIGPPGKGPWAKGTAGRRNRWRGAVPLPRLFVAPNAAPAVDDTQNGPLASNCGEPCSRPIRPRRPRERCARPLASHAVVASGHDAARLQGKAARRAGTGTGRRAMWLTPLRVTPHGCYSRSLANQNAERPAAHQAAWWAKRRAVGTAEASSRSVVRPYTAHNGPEGHAHPAAGAPHNHVPRPPEQGPRHAL